MCEQVHLHGDTSAGISTSVRNKAYNTNNNSNNNNSNNNSKCNYYSPIASNSLNNRNNNYGGVIQSACVGEQHHSFITLQPRSSHSAVHL